MTMVIPILGLSIFLQLVSAYQIGRYSKLAEERWQWILFSLILIVTIAMDGLILYLGNQGHLQDSIEITVAFACLAKSILVIVSVFWFVPRMTSLTRWVKVHRTRSERYRVIFEHLPIIAALKDVDSNYILANPAYAQFLNQDVEGIIGKKDNDLFSGKEAALIRGEDRYVIKLGLPKTQEIELNHPDGKKNMQITRVPIFGEAGICESLVFSAIDVSASKQFEDAWLRSNEEKKHLNEINQQQIRLERLIAAISTHFIRVGQEHIDRELHQSLKAIGEMAGVDYCFILLLSEGERPFEIPYEWNQEDSNLTADLISNLPFQGTPWWSGNQNRFDPIFLSLSMRGNQEYEDALGYMHSSRIKSFLALPMVNDRSVIGYWGLATQKAEQMWSKELLSLFRLTSETFVSIIKRKRETHNQSETNKKINSWIARLEQNNRETSLVTELENLLLVCHNSEEAYPIIGRYAKRLFPTLAGALYVIQFVDRPAERVAYWGQKPPAEMELAVNDCWGLRRGRVHIVNDGDSGPQCLHLGNPRPNAYLCLPLIAQGEMFGLLHLRADPEGSGDKDISESVQHLASMVAEYIALALSNLSLKNALLIQAIRDPLTNLYNRRYMEETLERELHRAIRHSMAVGLIMFDLDGFKLINDAYGHECGDLVLKSLGELLQTFFRGEDVACRYGGDEFMVILPESSLTDTIQRAEQLRSAWKNINIKHEGNILPLPTLSIGVVAYPDHGNKPEQLLQLLDSAAYSAKTGGKDRVVIGNE